MHTKKEKLLNDTYQKWMQTSLYDLPLDGANDFVDPKIMGYGTAIDEKILSIYEYRDLINRQREQSIGLKMNFEIIPVFRNISNKEDSAFFVDELKASITLKEGNQELFLRLTTILEYVDNKWIVVHWHGSVPTETLGETDTWLVNEWKRKNEELEKLVDEKTFELLNKNRELEIESALEKVRTIAMWMREPADMLDVCKTISLQLESLGVKEIRNVQTAIFYEIKKTYINFEYYTKHNKSLITEVDYRTHELQELFANKMIKGVEELFSETLKSKEVKDWYTYQKTTNQFADSFLETAESLSYYWYSLGPVALGMSTYMPLNEQEINLFKRFRNVFELSYKRYVDIAQAEAQAKEAQIEASLERVRSRTMGMQKSDELKEVIQLVYEQLVQLNIQTEHTGFIMDYKTRDDYNSWIADRFGTPSQIIIPYFDCIYYNHFNDAKEKGLDFFALTLSFEEKNRFYNELFQHLPGFPEESKKIIFDAPAFAISTVLLENVALYIENFAGIPYSEEENNTLIRFGKVFQQTYTRFLDLQKAEAQNKIIQADNDRKTKELEDARQLQLSMLPKELPQFPNLDIAVYMKTSTEVGGDYYDFNIDDNGTLTVLVGDATGHGMMSGMMVSIMKSFFISNRRSLDLKQFFENANNSLKEMHLGSLMMPLIGVQINSEKLIATNAGMPSLLYFRNKSQKAGEFVSNNLPLGGMKGTQYLLKEIRYEKGDVLLLMSDGFAELKNENNEQYGYTRVKEQFRAISHKSANEIIAELKNQSSQWLNGSEPEDDVTFVVIKVK